MGYTTTATAPAWDWRAAVKSGLIAGVILLVLPQGIPWSALVFTSGAAMGRTVASPSVGSTLALIGCHLLLAILYAGIISALVRRFYSWRALVAGGIIGLLLYWANFACIRLAAPHLLGNEARVVFSHAVFGLFAAAAYTGLMTRKRTVRSWRARRRSHVSVERNLGDTSVVLPKRRVRADKMGRHRTPGRMRETSLRPPSKARPQHGDD